MIFPLRLEIAHLQHRRTALPLPQIAHLKVKLRPVIRKPSRRVVTSAAGMVPTRLPSFQHADAVRYGHDLFQTVAYEDDADPLSRSWRTTMQ